MAVDSGSRHFPRETEIVGRHQEFRLYEGIRAAVLGGRLSAGARLPSTRAADLAVSRNTIAGVSAPPLSAYYLSATARPGLWLGYWSTNGRKIQEGARRLTGAMLNWLR